jgi:hypothetical protein
MIITACRVRLPVGYLAVLLISSCAKQNQLPSSAPPSSASYANQAYPFTQAVRQADKVVLYEGLPHQMFESRALEQERRTKAVQDLNGYPFYQEPLTLKSR